jgi:hypothetical protein
MHKRAKQTNIPAELADSLISSLSGLTAIEGDELRRQVIMLLIDHSYALGYVAGAGAGLMARMRSRLMGQDIKLALSTIRERLTMIFRDHGRRPHQMFPLQGISLAPHSLRRRDRRMRGKKQWEGTTSV